MSTIVDDFALGGSSYFSPAASAFPRRHDIAQHLTSGSPSTCPSAGAHPSIEHLRIGGEGTRTDSRGNASGTSSNLRIREGEQRRGLAAGVRIDTVGRSSYPRVRAEQSPVGALSIRSAALRRVVLSNMGATPQQHLHSRQFWRKVQGYSDSEAARVHTFSLVCPLISRPLGHIILKKGEYRRDHGVRLMRVRSTQQLEPWPTTRRGGILVAGSGVRPKQTLTIVFPLPVVSPTHHPAITPTTNQHEHEIRIDSRDGFYC